MFRRLGGIFLTLWGVFASSISVFAAAGPWWTTDHGAVRLIAESNAVGSATKMRLGLHFKMKPGWKIYWRSPGDAGFPPRPNWKGSQNLADIKVDWPAPTRFSVLGLETVGYKKEVILPLTAQPFEPGKAVNVKATVPYLTCEEICVPYEAKLTLALPAGPAGSSPEGFLIKKYVAAVPKKVKGPNEIISSVSVVGPAGKQTLQVAAAISGKLDLLIEGPRGFRFGKAKPVTRTDGKTVFAALVSPPIKSVKPGKPIDLAGKDIVLTLLGGPKGAIELKTQPSVGVVTQTPPPVSVATFLSILALAVLGGLILNLMPCVLPVLSIKLLTVVSHGGEAPARIRAGFLASAAGILACFLLLGTVAVALQSAGLAAGWGIQFQQPAFLAFMIAVITLFACNMWGLFEIRLPGAVADAAVNAGSDSGSHETGLRGHFLTGAFATLLATPCTAPFLGTAVGFALSRGPVEIYAVFIALGIGLALPWIVVAAFPVLANKLPKPGHWMITLKRILSIALIGTAVWLLSVLWFQIGSAATGIIASLMIAIVFSIWQYRHLGDKARFATWIVVGLLTAISMVGAHSFICAGGDRVAAADDKTWRKFDLAAVDAEMVKGNTVFVDVTADWCLTCQVNKSLVLNRGRVAEILGAGTIIAMKADWTKPDPAITAYLKSFGRYGIPFNVVYGPSMPRGVPLPEILTESSVLAAFEKAGGKAALAGR